MMVKLSRQVTVELANQRRSFGKIAVIQWRDEMTRESSQHAIIVVELNHQGEFKMMVN